ncbi:hypothetical protein BKK56_03645 [Rodentibacter genomosp. 2]|uniref:hypothetical protein n=1 Tax=Rodentibacter genomosp. 2 TaxID=1908266 RepID=UPI0009D5D6DC|nr:hypothetical protein BKK56_03645 [Rodentibacter genomosp. 2]
MGYVMCLCGCAWIKRLVLSVLLLLCYSNSYAAASWSSVGFWYSSKNPPFMSDEKGDFRNVCSLSQFSGARRFTDGDDTAKRQHMKMVITDYSIVYNYGHKKLEDGKHFGLDSQFTYAEKLDFSSSLKYGYRRTLVDGLAMALSKGNCDVAGAILDTLNNGKPEKCKDDKECVFLKNGDDACIINSDGSSYCNWDGPAERCDENGENCSIVIGNKNTGSLNDYASSEQKDKTKPNEQPPSDNNPKDPNSGNSSGSDSGSNSGGQGSGGSSKGDSDKGGEKEGNGKGDKGDGKGSGGQGGTGSGNGKGDGEGDDEGDGKGKVTYPELEQFNIEKALRDLKNKMSGFVGDVSMPSGSCEPFTFTVFGKSETVNMHCQIMDRARPMFEASFTMVWGVLALLIVLSA